MHEVAVRAIELVLVVGRGVRILRLDVLRFFNERRGRVALDARIDRRDFRLGHVHVLTVAHLAAHALGNMAVRAELSG